MDSENLYHEQDENQKSATKLMARPDTNDLTNTSEVTKTLFAAVGRRQDVTLSDFEIKKVIGRGSFGKVFLVALKGDNSEVFAMKCLGKDVILDMEQVEATKQEKEVLMDAKHPFLVGMRYVFQSETKIFFVMRFVRGGELFTHLRTKGRFPEQ